MTGSSLPAVAAWPGHLRLATVTQLLRPDATGDAAGRNAAMAACYHASASAGTPFVFGWIRTHAGGPVTMLTTTPVTGAGLIYPPSADGEVLTEKAAADLLGACIHWARLTVTSDPLVAAADPAPTLRLEDGLLDAWSEPFAWLLYATPLTHAEITTAVQEAALAEREARTRTDSPAHQLRADRARVRHRELAAGESTGAWRLHLAAGGTSGPAAVTLAGLLAACTDVTDHGYTLIPTIGTGSLDELLTDNGATLAGTPLTAALAQPPAGDIPGVTVRPRSPFAVSAPPGGQGLLLGQLLDRSERPAGQFRLPVAGLLRHTFVAGATGGGKTTTVQAILRQATDAGIPWLVIEPAKAEYAQHVGGDVTVLRVGALDQPAAGLNPLRPASGFSLRTHADMVKAMLVAAFRADEPFPQILAAAIDACYRDTGWDLTVDAPANPDVEPRWPTLDDLRHAADQIVAAAGYGGEVEANVRGFVNIRLASLTLGTAGAFLAADHDLDLPGLLTRNTIIELEDLGDDTDKALIIGTLLLHLSESLRVRGPAGGHLRHLTVIEEAHRLLRRPTHDGPAAHAVETFAALLAEVRAYGEGLIIADQIPTKLIPDTLKNTATKIVHRLPAADDRDAIGAGMNLTPEQSTALVTLPPGTAAVFTDGMRATTLVRIPEATAPPLTVHTAPAGRHDACPVWCATQPSTLHDERTADAFLRRHPVVAAWADLAVLGHLLALPTPRPTEEHLLVLRALPNRIRDLALHQATRRAIHARSTATADEIAPTPFSRHVASDLAAALDNTDGCPDERERWSMTAFRWNPIRLSLLLALQADPQAGRHAFSPIWEQTTRRAIPGQTAQAQRELVDQWCAQAQAPIPADHWLPLIVGRPAWLPTLLRTSTTAVAWDKALNRLLVQLPVLGGWPKAYLTSAALSRHAP